MVDVLVCLKTCLDVSQIMVDEKTGEPRIEQVPYKISDFDENALEEAVRIKEKYGGQVSVLTVTSTIPKDAIRKALAIGADKAYIVTYDSSMEIDPLVTANILAAAAKRIGNWDLIICGEGSLDEYNSQVGPRLAEALAIPSITYVYRLEISGRRLVAERSVEAYAEIVECEFPLLVTVGMEINQPRMPTLIHMMASSRKPVVEWQAMDLGLSSGDFTSAVKTLGLRALRVKRKRIFLEGAPEEIADKLFDRLVEEGVLRIENEH